MTVERQHAALPYVVYDGNIEVLLLTSRDTQRWVIPKGWPKKRMTAYELAALEAFEEAGLEGQIEKEPLGCYHYVKRLKRDEEVLCRVDVFPMLVQTQLLDWPEKEQRNLSWVAPQRAAQLVDEKELSWLLRSFGPKGASDPPLGLMASMMDAFKRLLPRTG